MKIISSNEFNYLQQPKNQARRDRIMVFAKEAATSVTS